MRIAFDAKRAFTNNTGLGNYSRSLLTALFQDFPQHDYYLFTPRLTPMFEFPQSANVHIQTPTGINKLTPSLWRSNKVKTDLNKLNIDLYHGLSHEIPFGIQKTGVKSVVTIHDLIFERFPEQYKSVDVRIYRGKFKNACNHANKILAISQQTKQDLIDIYKVPESKISVCYQSCDEKFMHPVSTAVKEQVRNKYGLPQKYFLSVGSVIERKNLMLICKALHELKKDLGIPLVVIGGGGGMYMQQVKGYISKNGLEQSVIFLSDRAHVPSDDLPAIYQSSLALVYPSLFEGFGIPVLEGIYSGVPVITSKTSGMAEAGGDAAYYIDPLSVESMKEGLMKVVGDAALRHSMIEKGSIHALNFSSKKAAAAVMDVYNDVMK